MILDNMWTIAVAVEAVIEQYRSQQRDQKQKKHPLTGVSKRIKNGINGTKQQ